MRSRVLPSRANRCVRAALVAAAFAVAMPTAAPADGEAPAVAPLREEVERLRLKMELAYLDVKADHLRVRSSDWEKTPFGEDFSNALTDHVRESRSRERAPSASEELDAAAAVVSALAERNVTPPLTRVSTTVVLAETGRAARADRGAGARDLFVAAAHVIFAPQKTEDVWDASFTALPLVAAFREAQKKLADAERPPAPPPEDSRAPSPSDGPAAQTPADGAPAEKSDPPAADPAEDDMVYCDRARPWVGPWTGWISELSEKQNRRAQRSLKAVWIDRHEVTCAQYLLFLESRPAADRAALLPQGWTLAEDGKVTMPEGRARHPVTGVTWSQADAYAASVGKRLPTADEWDRAAAGGDKEARLYPWGDSEEGKRWAHFGVEPEGTFPVDAFLDDATPDGVLGLAGNVAEIVSSYPDREDVPKSGPEKGRQIVVCGGSYSSRPAECVTSWRWVLDADASSPSVGFRCVAETRKKPK